MGNPPDRWVSVHKLRQAFNDGHYWERVQAGVLQECLKDRRHRTKPTANLPPCTHSEIYEYRDQHGERVAIVHLMRLPDGSIGASGRPDPKLLLVDGVVWHISEP